MRKVFWLTLLAVGVVAVAVWAEVNVNINIGPPALVVAPDPVLAVIPGTYVYFVVDLDADLFFYHGYWWRLHNGRWFRAAVPGGPWKHWRKVPPPLLNLPPGWRNLPPGQMKLKHSEVKRNWQQWEKERRWDRKESGAPAAQAEDKAPPKPQNAPGPKPKGHKGKK